MRVLLALLLFSPLAAAQQPRVVVPPNSAHTSRVYSPAVDAGDYLYISGQGPRAADGTLPAEFDVQVRQALDNIKAIVEAAGLTMDHVVYTQVYLEDISKYDQMNKIFREYFPKNPPARAVLGVARVPESSLEISAVAVRNLADCLPVYPPNYNHNDSASPGVLTHDRLFISSQSGSDPVTGKVPADSAAQVDLALDRFSGSRQGRWAGACQCCLRESIFDCGNSRSRHESALCTTLRVRQHARTSDHRRNEPSRRRAD